MTTSNTLADLIEQMVAEKTFGLDALASVQALKTKAIEQETKIKNLQILNEQRTEEIAGLRRRISSDERKESERLEREQKVAEREKRVTEMEKNEAVAMAKASVLQDVFGTIFKNTTIRENNLKALPFTHVNNGHSHSGYQGQRETVERTVE
jgi:predicted RNase H-like nuclease (RuvC/YqgF family)